MEHRVSRPAPARRTIRIVLVTLAILGVAIASWVVPRPFLASAPARSLAGFGELPSRQAALDADDGVVPDGETVWVFDETTPAVAELDPDLLAALRRAAMDAEADGVGLRINSGWRSPAYQDRLLQEAVAEHGSQEEAARWVATPEQSAHVAGDAVDVGPSEAAAWLWARGAAYGLCQVYGNEPWHFELRPEAIGGSCPPPYTDPTEDPRMQP